MVNELIGKKFGRLLVGERVENDKHGNAQWMCTCDCGNLYRVRGNSLTDGNTRSCGCLSVDVNSLNGSDSRSWKGGRYINADGYAVIHVGEWRNCGRGKYRLEHRVIMEKKLGRPLVKTETVHHINGVRADNRVENLELWVVRHPKGRRVTTQSVMECIHRVMHDNYGNWNALCC